MNAMSNYKLKTFNCSTFFLPNNTVCLEHPEEMLKPWKTHPLFFEIITIHLIIFVFGVFGNVTVILVMAGDRKFRSATNFFLVSLAFGDLLMLCVYGPLETYTHFVIKWDEKGAVCKTAKFAEFLSATSSVLNLLAVTIERFIVIIFPIKSQTICTVSNIIRAVLTVWMLSFALAFPVVLTTKTYKITFTNNRTSLTLNYCTNSGDSPDFVVYQFFVIFFIPSITMTVCYSFVIRELWVSAKKMNLLTNKVRKSFVAVRRSRKASSDCSVETEGSLRKSEVVITMAKDEAKNARKQVIKMLILVIILFYFCWGPRVIMDVLQKLNFISFNQWTYRLRITFNVTTFFHGCINPFIYSFMSKNFQSRLVAYLEKWSCKRRSLKWSTRFAKFRPRHRRSRSEKSRQSGRRQRRRRRRGPGPHGSFLSCETKTTELESGLHSTSQSYYIQTSC